MEVRKAIHIRTGQRARTEAVDKWLENHGVQVERFDDVFAACVHLLKRYDQVPELALVGADWLAGPDFQIIRYIRETWPRTGIVIYGASADTPTMDFSPFVMTCATDAAWNELRECNPSDVARRIAGEPVAPRKPAALPSIGPSVSGPAVQAHGELTPLPTRKNPVDDSGAFAGKQAIESSADDTATDEAAQPRTLLTPEELSALFEGREDD